MARVINRWDPSRNVGLVVAASAGPLVLESGDPRWELVARQWVEPLLYAGMDMVDYLRFVSIEDGSGVEEGLRVNGYQYMPDGMAFLGADPLNGEPQPEDLADPHLGAQYRYLTAGHRMALRGWIGSFDQDHLNVEFEVWWGDGDVRNALDARGAWTGAVLSALNGGSQSADHLVYALHGKRLGDPSWEIRGGYVDRPVGPFVPSSATVAPWDGVDSGRFRILVAGASPAWTVTAQYWDPGIPDWVDIASSVVDLRAYAVPGFEDAFFLNGYLFHGATKVFPGALASPPPEQDTYFRRVSISQFSPWVLDRGDLNLREILARLDPMFGPLPYWLLPVISKTPVIDIMHFPTGAYAPVNLRVLDADGGWGVESGPQTILMMVGIEDRKLMTVTPTLGRYTPVCLADSHAVGPILPFAYVGRYRLKGLSTMADERCLVSFGRAGFRATPAPGQTGLGMTWRPANGGELVLKYWDGVAANWLEVVCPLRADEYDDTVVDLGFCWTGAFGGLAQRPDNQLRLVVDGVTKAEAIEPALDITGTITSFIGTGNPLQRLSFEGIWFGGATFYEPATDTDLLHAFDEEGVGGFVNHSFEEAADSGRPGEAADWEWQSFQGQGGWAEFSAYRAALAAFCRCREDFEGGWRRVPAWVYDDEAARLAAVGFTVDDVGQAALQLDIDRNYILTGHAPITWAESAAGENQGWEDDLVDLAVAAALFNEGIPAFEGTVEHFNIWGQTWDMMVWSGAPWLDVYNLVPPCEDTLGPFGGPTGFDGWFDHITATNLDPLCSESFEEAWGNDPFSTAAGQRWQPDTAPNGVLRGEAITFPLFIPHNENRLVILTDAAIPAMFSLPSQTYTSMGPLVADLNAALAAFLPGLGLTWGSWTDGDREGLTFGWDGSTLASVWFGFGSLQSELFRDARPRLGLRSFSPGGHYTGVGIPCWLFPSLPAGVSPSDRFLLDSWSANSFLTVVDSVLGLMVLENDMVGATFDAAVPDPTYLERFGLAGWVSPVAVWIADLSAVVLTQAMFDSAIHDREDFLDTEWPDEPFPT